MMLQRVKRGTCAGLACHRQSPMNPALPPALKARIEVLLEGKSRNELAKRAAAISKLYRAGGGSTATVTDEASVIAYLVARMPATYAAAAAVFASISHADSNFTPQSLLDVGAGPGTTSWAAGESWPGLQNITMVDSNPQFLRMAKRLAETDRTLASAEIVAGDLQNATWTLPNAELVAASFVLAEIADLEGVVARLWSATKDMLVLIEPGTPAGFSRIRAARRQLIEEGANVLAPCTHNSRCPIEGSDWCHFSQRLPRSRHHLKAKDASVPFEDERSSYVALTRRPIARANLARIIAPPKQTKMGVTLALCTDRGLQSAFVAKRQRDVYAVLRKAKCGDTILSAE